MADRDVSRLTVEAAQRRIAALRERLRERMPYGPGRVRLSPEEFRRWHDKLTPEGRMQIAQTMGVDAYLQAMKELYHGRNNVAQR